MMTLASRAAGVVTRQELLASGLSSSTIVNRVRQGFLLNTGPGLYEVPEMTNRSTSLFRAVKSVPGSAISHTSAGRMYEFPLEVGDRAELVHITAPWGGSRTQMQGVVLHRTRLPCGDEIDYPISGLPVLSPARTILDLAGDPNLSHRRLSHVIETQITAGRIDPDELRRLLERPGLRGVAGARRLRTLVDGLFDGEPIAESMLERRFQRLLAQHDLSGFRRQVEAPWYDGRRGVVDFANSEVELIVEVDGRRWHSVSQAMAEDRRRDRLAAAHGWQVMRVTWEDLTTEPAATAEQVAAAVAARRQRWRPQAS